MPRKNVNLPVLILLILLGININHAASTIDNEPPHIGNYALPAPQQPGPFISFGQNLIGRNIGQLFLTPNFLKGNNQSYLDLTVQYLYGLSDEAVILFTVPAAINYYEKPDRTSGLSDASAQIEYSLFFQSNTRYAEEASLVVEITSPTGALDKNPSTGNGAPGFFIGTTYNHMYDNWYWFLSPGINWTTPSQNNQIGTEYYYQAGIGRHIKSEPNKYILFALLEFDGLYTTKDKLAGLVDPDSGGNIIFITPSIMYSFHDFLIQAGFSIPAMQQWNGTQEKTKYNAAVVLAWTFY